MNFSIMLHPKSNSFLKKVEKDIAEQIKKNFKKFAKAQVYKFDRYDPSSLILQLKKIL